MQDDVNLLWVGGPLPPMALLSLASCRRHGHRTTLWHYDDIPNVPAGVVLKDGREFMSVPWRYRGYKGSYGGFADVFRTVMLHHTGGWYIDTDVAVLQPLRFPDEYVFRPHRLGAVLNIVRAPANSAIMKAVYEEMLTEINEDTGWEKPIHILNAHLRRTGLDRHIVSDSVFGRDDDWSEYLEGRKRPTHAIHWCCAMFNVHDRASNPYAGLLREMLEDYGIPYGG